MANYTFVIDLHRCTGCGSCVLACKIENNVPEGIFWCNHLHQTLGKFPEVKYTYIPTMCNHCEAAPCVEVCPVDPKSMYKAPNGLILHDVESCIGCRLCEEACPYGAIFYNEDEPHAYWRSDQKLMNNLTSSPVEVTEKVKGKVLPYYNPDRETTYPGIRPKNKVEKCSFCDHRIVHGLEPYCNEVCPSNARFFGDLDDPGSTVAQLLQKYPHFRLEESLGTEPKVYYIRQYNPQ